MSRKGIKIPNETKAQICEAMFRKQNEPARGFQAIGGRLLLCAQLGLQVP